MAFTSLEFLFLFFPVCLGAYYLFKGKARNVFLVAASLLFYAFGEPKMVLLLILSIALNYFFAVRLSRCESGEKKKVFWLVIMLVWNFALLFYYKYFCFTLSNVYSLLKLNREVPIIFQPLGISFFTFRTVSYCLDVYWGTVKEPGSIFDAALYISFFPQLTMGPITKYNEFSSQLTDRCFNEELFFDGIKRIIIGLAKKLIIADHIASTVDSIFALNAGSRAVVLSWLGVLCYIIQLYYDFSGYSDIAIGIGQLFGFRTPENFNYPFCSKSVAEYWSRWHITLGTWLKNYLYTPVFRSCQFKEMSIGKCNILALLGVWLFAGIWHGVGWNYVFYGMFYFFFIAAERLIEDYQKKKRKRLKLKKQPETTAHKVFSRVYFFIVLIFGQLLFRSPGLRFFVDYALGMFGLRGNAFVDSGTFFFWKQSAFLLIIGWFFAFPVVRSIREKIIRAGGEKIVLVSEPVIYGMLLVAAIAFAMTNTYQSFIYFQF